MTNSILSSGTAPQRRGLRHAIIFAVLAGLASGFALAPQRLEAEDQKATITIDNFTFAPAELVVPVGTVVTWVNHDDIPHSLVESNKVFHSRALDTNESYSFTFTKAGDFNYFCGLHPHMTGKVIVRP